MTTADEFHELADGSSVQRSIPAWLLSAIAHVMLCILLALSFREIQSGLGEEAERSVGIVLAHRNAQENVEYFEESDAEAARSQAADATDPQSTAPIEQADKPPLDAEIMLPGKPDHAIGAALSDELVAIPSLQPGTGRIGGLSAEEEAAILAEDAARPRRLQPSGPTGEVGIFGGPRVAGHSFVFVIDRSKSMGGEGLGALIPAAKELYAALSGLSPHHKFQILAYNHVPTYVTRERRMLDVSPENVHQVPAFFNSMVAMGQTNHQSALLAALRLSPDVIFLLTDGDPDLTSTQIQTITDRAGGQTSIHCVRFGSGPLGDDEHFMNKLARRNSGTFRYVDMSKRRSSP